MPFGKRLGTGGFLLLAGLALAAGLAPRTGRGAPPEPAAQEKPAPTSPRSAEEGPMPLRRVLVTADFLDREMKRLGPGALERLSRRELEELVRRAGAGAGRRLPRLVEAGYRAVLGTHGLTGTGVWKVTHAGPGPGVLDLQPGGQPFNLALRQPRFEHGDALVAEFDGRHLGLLVETPGDHAAVFEWSARGEARPEGLQLDLKVPPCPVATLELDVPADQVVSAPDGALVSGPYPAEAPPRRLWKVAFGGRSQVSLLVRRSAGPAQPPPLILARQKTVQRLGRDGLDATFEFTLEALHRGIRELVCACDPILRPCEVLAPQLDGWEVKPGATAKDPTRLIVRFREPVREGILQVRCLAPLAEEGTGKPPARDAALRWVSPAVRLVGAVPRGETIELSFHPDLRIEAWEPGGFRLTGVATDGPGDSPGRQRLTLMGGGTASGPGGTTRRPEARLRTHGVDFQTRQQTWWQITPAGMSLTTQVAYEVCQGQLFQLPVRLPAGWEVERVEVSPTTLLRNWALRRDREGSLLLIDLQRPVTPAPPTAGAAGAPRVRGPVLTLRLHPSRSGPLVGRELPFPDVTPLGARFRAAGLAIDVDEQVYDVTPRTSAPRSEPEEPGPWNKRTPALYYACHGEPVRGTLRLRPRPPQMRATVSSEVFVASGRAAVQARLLLEAQVGSLETIDLALTAPAGGGWEWRVAGLAPGGSRPANRGQHVRRAERLTASQATGAAGLLGAGRPLTTAALLAALPRGEHWRLTLDRPLRVRERLLLEAACKLEPAAGRWEVPLPLAPGADRMEGEVTLHLAGADLVQVETAGLSEGRPLAAGSARRGKEPAGAWRTFRYGLAGPPGGPRLVLRGRALAADNAAVAQVSAARLASAVGGDGVLEHRFSFTVRGWGQDLFPVRLPAGAQPVAAQVDGRWLTDPLPAPDGDGRVVLELPVPDAPGAAPAGETAHCFEVVYTTRGPAPTLWARLEAPVPVLPAAPTTFRRTWQVPPGLAPLFEGRQRRLPGTSSPAAADLARHRLGDLFCLSLPGVGPEPAPDASRRDALAAAAERLHLTRAGQALSLAELVEHVAFDVLREHPPLVVDAAALREAGLGPAAPVVVPGPGAGEGALPWAPLGLCTWEGRAATVLTTRQRLAGWRDQPPGPDLEAALAEAVRAGQDDSGRFRSALAWLATDPDGKTAGDALRGRPLPGPGLAWAGWSEWEPVAGASGEAVLVIVRHDAVTAAGLAAAVALGLGLWALRRHSSRGRLAFLLVGLALAGLGVLWLPAALQDLAWWPLLAGGLLALGWYVRAATVPASVPASPAALARAAATAGLLAALGLAGPGGAFPDPPRAPAPAPPDPFTVYLLAGTRGEEDQAVLAPAALLERLRAQAGGAGPGPVTVLLSASYEGRVGRDDRVAEFEAVFQAHSLGDEPARLVLPLDGVQLHGEVLLDGARAYPVPLSAPQVGYALSVRGRGRHKVEARFRVPVADTREEREVQFTAPRLAQSQLVLRLPREAGHVQALVKYGAQRVTADAGQTRLEVDVGGVNAPLHLRWHRAATVRRPARVQFREAYLWDLRDNASSLTALLRYSIADGAVTALTIDLPPELEVRGAEARRAAGTAGPAGSVRLRDWQVAGSGRQRALRLFFPDPAAGEVEVLLDLVPRAPLPAQVTLPLPTPHGHRLPRGGFLAYRTRGVQAQRVGSLRVTGIAPTEFAPFWPTASRPAPDSLAYACAIGRERGQPPELRLHLLLPSPAFHAVQDVRIRAGSRQAEVKARADLEAPAADLSVVEWEVQSSQPFLVAGVAGPDVRRWSQQGSRLLVWLDRTVSRTHLELTGWMPVPAEAARKPRPGRAATAAGVARRLDLPCLRLLGARTQITWLRVTAGRGMTLTPAELRRLLPLPDPRPPGQEFAAVSRDPSYGGRFRCVTAGERVSARVLTFAEVRDRRLTFTAVVAYHAEGAGLRSATVRLRNWEGEVRLEVPGAPGPIRPRERRRGPGERTWVVDLPAGMTDDCRLVLTGSLPPEESALGVAMPEVSVPEAVRSERWVAVAGRDLKAEPLGGLTAVPTPARTLLDWPREADRVRRTGGAAWKVAGTEWGLLLLPRERSAGQAPLHVFLCERTAEVVDGRSWLHEAVLWLRHEANTDLDVTFPGPARVVAVAVDGVEGTPLQPDARRLWLPLPGRAGVRRVRLRWLAEDEPLARPRLNRLELAGARPGPTVWTLRVPAGWYLSRPAGAQAIGTGPARAAALALHRAAARLEVSAALAGAGRPAAESLVAVQRGFYRDLAQAALALRAGAERGGVAGPGGQSLADWLQRLQAGNRELARRDAFEEVRARAERQAARPGTLATTDAGIAEGGRGMPLSWQAGAEEDEAPQVRLAATTGRETRRALAGSGQWLGLLAALWALSFAPFLADRLRRLWPEQALLLGGLGWWLVGPTAVVVFLLLLGVWGRLFLLAHTVRSLRRPTRPTVSPETQP